MGFEKGRFLPVLIHKRESSTKMSFYWEVMIFLRILPVYFNGSAPTNAKVLVDAYNNWYENIALNYNDLWEGLYQMLNKTLHLPIDHQCKTNFDCTSVN